MTFVLGAMASVTWAQQINGDFDQSWAADKEGNAVPTNYDSKRPGMEPFGWTASNVNQKVLMSKKATLVTQDADRSGNSKGHSVKMVNTYVGAMGIGSNAPAYVTLGKPWVLAVSDISNCDGGTLGGKDFQFMPDAIAGYYKSSGLKTSDPAKIIVYAWKGSYTSSVGTNADGKLTASPTGTASVTDQDRIIWNQAGYSSKTKDAELIVKSELPITDNESAWKKFTLDLNYVSTNRPEKINVILSASNYWQRSSIEANGTLWTDDVEFIYYHALTDLKYNGTTLTGFNENVTSYDLSDEVYDASKVSFTKKGVAATVEQKYDEKTGVLTITVKGDDFSANPSSFTTYTIQFANHLLTDVKYDGATVKGFAPNTYSYDLSGQVFDASKLSYTALSSAATVEQTYDELTGKVQITVEGPDFDKNSKHTATYTLQFKPSKVLTLTNPLSVTINGTTSAPQTTTYTLIIAPDEKTATLLLKNFMLGDGEDAVPVGNIELKNVTVDGTSLATSQNIFITPGDDPSVPEDVWLGPALGQVPVSLDATLVSDRLDAVINIDMQQALNQTIKVVLAPSVQITPDQTLSIPADALANVTFIRSFKQGWNSLILPFPATTEQLGASEADKLTELHSSYLKFEKVDDGALQPHVPYLVHFDEATDLTLYYGGQVTAIKSGEAYESVVANAADAATARFVGNYTAKFNMNGKYGIYTVSEGKEKIVEGGAGATLPATAAYFDFQNISNPTALSVKFGNDPTGISDLVIENGQVKQCAAGVYNLQGIKLNANGSTEGLPAGVYIVNGQKVLVK